ncbi:unnamed protein product [Paramecium primaurelia]|uniref:RCC1-like domain-containing protein n=1 Tax=Paramecium primaurelia TaxID=5886 RepID=A0A8S1M375_PARPR|nr:unnamed protein product [Paramecium primaurelia]
MKVFAKGLNFMGQLGQGNFKSLEQFALIPDLQNMGIKQLEANMTQSFALLQDGQLLHWGWQLDTMTENRTLSFYKRNPTLCKLWQKYSPLGTMLSMRGGIVQPVLLNKPIIDAPIKSFQVGGSFIIIQMNDGVCYGMGENYKGQLGNGELKYQFQFKQLQLPTKDKVIQVGCGYQHSLLLTEGGVVYGSGKRNHYQFIETRKNDQDQIYVEFTQHRQLMDIRNQKIQRISSGAHHTILQVSDNRIYACGLNIYGQCGMNNEIDRIKEPTEVFLDLQPNESIQQIVSGQAHNLVLTSNNRLIFFGCLLHNQMGVKSKFDFEFSGQTEINLPLESDEKIVKIYAKFDRSAVITSKGDCIIWGGQDLRYMDIPYYETYTRLIPELGLENIKIQDIALGFSHIMVLTD